MNLDYQALQKSAVATVEQGVLVEGGPFLA